jgi:hypothetical protein
MPSSSDFIVMSSAQRRHGRDPHQERRANITERNVDDSVERNGAFSRMMLIGDGIVLGNCHHLILNRRLANNPPNLKTNHQSTRAER